MFNQEAFFHCVETIEKAEGKLAILSGPTAAGKDTVLSTLSTVGQAHEVPIRSVRSCTTKQPRQRECSDPTYRHISTEEFWQYVHSDLFLEHTGYEQGTHSFVYFGTTKDELLPQKRNELVFWKINPDRFVDIISILKNDSAFLQQVVVPIFLGAPSLLTLYFRARSRAGSQEEWNSRLRPNFRARIHQEYSLWNSHQDLLRPHTLNNAEDVQTTCKKIIELIKNKPL